MTDPINLRQARKRRERAARERTAQDNRIRYGRSRADREIAGRERDRDASRLDGHRREDTGAGAEPDAAD